MQLSCGRVWIIRSTPIYKELMGIFRKAKKPYPVGHILAALYKAGLSPNKTTVYRQLEKMEKDGLVRRVNISDAKATYEAVSAGHHHHLVCERCGEVRDITLRNERALLQAIAGTGFKAKNHKLEIFCLCASCAD